MQFYNVHSHVFTMKNAPKHFLQLYLPKIAANLVDKISDVKAGSVLMESLLNHLGNGGKRYASFLKIGKSADQLSVFENLMQQYDDPTMKFTALTMFMEKCGADVSESGFEGQLEEILMVKKQYPDNLLIFLGIDPRWKFTGTELKKTVEGYFNTRLKINSSRSVYPFIGLKLYPSMGFYAFDERLKETFEWAAENDVPVLSHCNYLGGIYNNDTGYVKGNLNPADPYSQKKYADNFPGVPAPSYQSKNNFFKKILGTNKNAANLDTCSYFLEPASYRTMIDYFSRQPKPLKICLAHFGGDDHIIAENSPGKKTEKLFGMLQENWCGQIKSLLKFPGVYTDISYALSNPKVHCPVFQELNEPAHGERILFGTDFFLTERELPEKSDYGIFKEKAMNITLSNFNNTNAWEQIASNNTNHFLQSKYYNGTVI
ncbi:MAG TPA: amidohydrolase family protein [Chitinophagaceae bacterium]|nr:amidohydrolase family protein [Chitinophagaceae bacterium]